MDGVRAFSETGRGAWKGGVSSLEPDGRCIPGTHGRVVCFMQNQRDELIVIGGAERLRDASQRTSARSSKITSALSSTANPAITANPGGVCFRKKAHARTPEEPQGWEVTNVSDTLNSFDNTGARTPLLVCWCVDCRNGTLNQEMSATLQCKPQGGWSVNCTHPVMYERRRNEE